MPSIISYNAAHFLLVNQLFISILEPSPYASISPTRILMGECLDALRELLLLFDFLELDDLGCIAGFTTPHGGTIEAEQVTQTTCRDRGMKRFQSSELHPEVKGSALARCCRSFKMSMSMTSSPTFCLSFWISPSLRSSSSLGLVLRQFSPPARKVSYQCSISAVLRPCVRTAFWAVVLSHG